MRSHWAIVAIAAAVTAPAQAVEFEFGELTGVLNTQLAGGVAMRTEDRKPELVGKLNLPGQEQFCEDKPPAGSPPGTPAPGINCQTVAGNAAFMALPGAFSVNNDNGNLNYDRGDLVNAAVKLAPRLQLTWGNFGLDLSGLYFYDAINSNFDEIHPNNKPDNNGFQPRNTPRPDAVEDAIGSGFRLYNAYVSGVLPYGDGGEVSFKIGDQVLSLGTSTLLVFNSLNNINPPDVNMRFLPGSDVRDVFRRVPMALFETNVTETVSVQALYIHGWRPIELPPIGSYYSANDVVGEGRGTVVALFGKYREDPDNLVGKLERTQGNANLISDAGRTLYRDPDVTPDDGGEYGVNVSYFADWLNNTSIHLTYLNLHSRFPLVGFVASQLGCAHASTNAMQATTDCGGFKTAANDHSGDELAPLDSVRVFLEYPEDIHAFGVSFSTNLGDAAWTGEIVYRPNQPLQIDPVDVGFAALQPIFPATNITVGTGVGGPSVTIPARRTAAPDFIATRYRGRMPQPGEVIPGYERFQTAAYNTSLLFLFGASDNPFRADQVVTLVEVGAFQIIDMPDLDTLQIGSPGPLLHRSAGVDGTGTPTAEQAATGAENRLNPTYKDQGFATAFSWGYRVLNQLTYEEVLPNVRLLPQVIFFHDVNGKSPLPTGEFVDGRKQATAALTVNYGAAYSGSLRYNWFFGAGDSNLLGDRDNLQFVLSYDF